MDFDFTKGEETRTIDGHSGKKTLKKYPLVCECGNDTFKHYEEEAYCGCMDSRSYIFVCTKCGKEDEDV